MKRLLLLVLSCFTCFLLASCSTEVSSTQAEQQLLPEPEENTEGGPTEVGDDTYVPDFQVGNLQFTNVWVEDVMEVGMETTIRLDVKNLSTEKITDATVRFDLVRLPTGSIEDLTDAEVLYPDYMVTAIPIDSLEVQEQKSIEHTFAVPLNVEEGIYYAGLFSLTDQIDPDTFSSVEKTAPASTIVGRPDKPNLRILSYQLENYSIELPRVIPDNETPLNFPDFTASVEVESMAMHAEEDVEVEFRLSFDQFLNKEYIIPFESSESYIIQTAEGDVSRRKLSETDVYAKECRQYDLEGNLELEGSESAVEGDEGVICAGLFRQKQQARAYSLHLPRELVLDLASHAREIAQLNSGTERQGELLGTLRIIIDPNNLVDEWKNNKADNVREIPIVYLSHQPDASSSRSTAYLGTNTGSTVEDSTFADCHYDHVLLNQTNQQVLGKENLLRAGYSGSFKMASRKDNVSTVTSGQSAPIERVTQTAFCWQGEMKTEFQLLGQTANPVRLDTRMNFDIDDIASSFLEFRGHYIDFRDPTYQTVVSQEISIQFPTTDALWSTDSDYPRSTWLNVNWVSEQLADWQDEFTLAHPDFDVPTLLRSSDDRPKTNESVASVYDVHYALDAYFDKNNDRPREKIVPIEAYLGRQSIVGNSQCTGTVAFGSSGCDNQATYEMRKLIERLTDKEAFLDWKDDYDACLALQSTDSKPRIYKDGQCWVDPSTRTGVRAAVRTSANTSDESVTTDVWHPSTCPGAGNRYGRCDDNGQLWLYIWNSIDSEFGSERYIKFMSDDKEGTLFLIIPIQYEFGYEGAVGLRGVLEMTSQNLIHGSLPIIGSLSAYGSLKLGGSIDSIMAELRVSITGDALDLELENEAWVQLQPVIGRILLKGNTFLNFTGPNIRSDWFLRLAVKYPDWLYDVMWWACWWPCQVENIPREWSHEDGGNIFDFKSEPVEKFRLAGECLKKENFELQVCSNGGLSISPPLVDLSNYSNSGQFSPRLRVGEDFVGVHYATWGNEEGFKANAAEIKAVMEISDAHVTQDWATSLLLLDLPFEGPYWSSEAVKPNPVPTGVKETPTYVKDEVFLNRASDTSITASLITGNAYTAVNSMYHGKSNTSIYLSGDVGVQLAGSQAYTGEYTAGAEEGDPRPFTLSYWLDFSSIPYQFDLFRCGDNYIKYDQHWTLNGTIRHKITWDNLDPDVQETAFYEDFTLGGFRNFTITNNGLWIDGVLVVEKQMTKVACDISLFNSVGDDFYLDELRFYNNQLDVNEIRIIAKTGGVEQSMKFYTTQPVEGEDWDYLEMSQNSVYDLNNRLYYPITKKSYYYHCPRLEAHEIPLVGEVNEISALSQGLQVSGLRSSNTQDCPSNLEESVVQQYAGSSVSQWMHKTFTEIDRVEVGPGGVSISPLLPDGMEEDRVGGVFINYFTIYSRNHSELKWTGICDFEPIAGVCD